jgi:hypothetical protein
MSRTAAMLAFALLACSGTPESARQATKPHATLTITPASASLAPGAAQRFQASLPDVVWSVEEGLAGGSIDQTGFYQPPAAPGTYHVVATARHSRMLGRARHIHALATVDVRGADLIDHGGEVMTSSSSYAIWWGGEGFPDDAPLAVEGLLAGLGSSELLALADQYLRGARATTAFAGSLFDVSEPPASPSAAEVAEEVCSVLARNAIAPSAEAIYLVFTSTPDGRSVCAWHSWGRCGETAIRVALIPNPADTACELEPRFSCGALSAAAMSLASYTSHEVLETITNPLGTAWSDAQGDEIADKCASAHGCTLLGGTPWELQQEWSNAAHGCALP